MPFTTEAKPLVTQEELVTQYQSLQTLPQAVYCNKTFSIKRYLETSLRLLYTEISDFSYQLSIVTKCNKLVLLFFVG